MKEFININKNWNFLKEDVELSKNIDFDDSQWETVNVPHTWNAIDGTTGSDYHRGASWYRKDLNIDSMAKGNRVFIEFNGSNSITDAYLNGQHLGQHKGGYARFRFDITQAMNPGGNNVLAVKVDNTYVDDVYPLMADFTFFGGIYRDVNLIITNNVHLDLMDYGSQGVYISQDSVSEQEACLTIKSKLVNSNNEDKNVRLWIDILDADNNIVTYAAKEVVLSAKENKEIEMPIVIDKPTLWQARNNPYMYSAKVYLTSFNDVLDELIIPFGVRTFNVDPEKGFFLNGKQTKLKGVSRHQDRKNMGWAITPKEHKEDMELIKEVGANSIRLAHYQQDQYFYDLCDQEGMVVWAEIPFISKMSETDLEGKNAKLQMTELIRQNYNHPSIMFWGIQNEIQIGGDRPEVRKVVNELNQLTKKEDPTRLTTMANIMLFGKDDEYNFLTDIVGFNRYFGWYEGKAEDFEEWIKDYHSTNPKVPLCISEYGAEGTIEYHTDNPAGGDYTEEYHTLYHEIVLNIFNKFEFLWATYVWNMFDFGANIRDEGGVKGRNNKGLITYDRKIKKDAFYMYKANWSDEKLVHITSKRFIDRATKTIAVKVYTNCEEVTLYLNDVEVSTKTAINHTVTFDDIVLKDGVNYITAKAKDGDKDIKDVAMFNKVTAPNESYLIKKSDKTFVGNWFDSPDVDDIEIKELIIADNVYSIESTFAEILESEEAMVVLRKYLGDFENNPMLEMAKGFKLSFLANFDSKQFNDKMMYAINSELIKIKK